MASTDAQQVFDTVLNLGYNEVIELTFPLASAADSFRSALYRERKNWAEKTGSRDQIQITRDYSGFPFKLEICKVPGMMGAVIKKADGSIEHLKFQDPATAQAPPPEVLQEPEVELTEIERQKELMRADGLSEEEINNYFQGDTE
jgi:hypothetical protein